MGSMTQSLRITIVSAPPYRAGLLGSRLVPALEAEGFTARVIDLSDGDQELGWSDPDGGADTGAVLFGDDLGVAPVLRFAADHPERVRALVLSAPTLEPNTISTNAVAELVERPDLDEGVSATAISLVRAGQLFSPARMADDDFIAEQLDGLAAVPSESDEQRSAIRTLAESRVSEELLAGLEPPCLVLGYAADAFASPHQVAAFASRLTDADVQTLPTGHGGGIEDPQTVAAAVRAFVDGRT